MNEIDEYNKYIKELKQDTIRQKKENMICLKSKDDQDAYHEIMSIHLGDHIKNKELIFKNGKVYANC